MKNLGRDWKNTLDPVRGELKTQEATRAAETLTRYFDSLTGAERSLNMAEFNAALAAIDGAMVRHRSDNARLVDVFYTGLVMLRTYEQKMKRRRVVFLPFEESHAGNFVAAIKGQFFKSHESELIPFEVRPGEYGYVRWRVSDDDILFKDSNNLNAKLAELDKNSTLYIVGHCAPGSECLSSEPTGRLDDDGPWLRDRVTASGLKKLLKHGLNSGFAGKIKIFGCNSALKEADDESFAERFAAKMDTTYFSCTIYGYNREVKKVKLRQNAMGSAKPFREQVR